MEDQTNKVNVKKKGKVRLVVSLLVFVILVVLLFLVFREKQSTENVNTEPEKKSFQSQDSPFSTYFSEQETPGEIEKSYSVDIAELDQDFLVDYEQLVSKPLENISEGWSWDKSWIYGKVISVESEDMLSIEVIIPDNFGTLTVTYTCDPRKTILLAKENFEVIATGVDFYSYVSPRSPIYTKCSNESCTKIGPECVFVDLNWSK